MKMELLGLEQKLRERPSTPTSTRPKKRRPPKNGGCPIFRIWMKRMRRLRSMEKYCDGLGGMEL